MPRPPATPLPAPELLRELFDYDPDQGTLRWRPRTDPSCFKNPHDLPRWNTRYAGKLAHSPSKRRYYEASIYNQKFAVHRIVYCMMTGEDPGHMFIDHINGDGRDNRWCNIRLADANQNSQNAKPRSKRVSGRLKGAYYSPSTRGPKKWRAYIQCDKKPKYLGSFSTEQAAHEAYCAAAAQMHGEYARTSHATML